MDDSQDSAAAATGPGGGAAPPADDATVISRAGDSSASAPPPPASRRSPSAEIGRLLEGSMLGPYRLDAFIGGGGMGAVFRARDTTLDRTVAVKVLARQESDDEETLRRFRNEAQSAARLDHENIGRVHAVGSDGDWHYIVFEFIEGENLRDLVRRTGPCSPARAVEVAIQVANALEHASQREVVHRDIKPSNIVITPAGRARIVDMGLARFHQMAGDAELTVSGMTLGTFDYISPEQARDPRAADVRSDLYSLGCTMFFMLAGRPPFAEGTMVQKLLQHQQTAAPAITELRPDVPRRLAAIIGRLMEKDPLARYQRPAVLVADLLACARAEGYPVTIGRQTAAVAEPPAAAPTRLPWLVPPLLLLVIVVGLWLRSTVTRRTPGEGEGGSAGLAAVDREPAADKPPAPAAAWRVIDTAADLRAALAELADEGVVEIDTDDTLELDGFATDGRRITIRSAAGRQPTLSITAGPLGAGIRVNGGGVSLERLAVHLAEPTAAAAVRQHLFEIAGGRLFCQGVVLRMAAKAEWPAGGERLPVFVSVRDQAAAATAAGGENSLVFDGVRAAGGATLLEVAAGGGGRTTLRWDGGALVTPGRLLDVEGSRRVGAVVDLELADLVVACGAGLVSMRDTPELPLLPRLASTASGCRFIVTDSSRPFIEQTGGGSPDDYLAACRWQDRHSRYEGGGVFRRIEGAAGRREEVFGSEGTPAVHEAASGGLPRPGDWSGWER